MLKQPKWNFKDTNLANFGGMEEKQHHKQEGSKEEAWASHNSLVGKEPGLFIWRIEQFKVVPWPKTRYGYFYQGDAYLVLKSYQKPGSNILVHHVHFWLGHSTSTDEMGTVAYKAVELDDYLDGLATQHREIQGSESSLFLSYFKRIILLCGGVASGFHHYQPDAHVKRLLKVRQPQGLSLHGGHGRKQLPVRIYEVSLDPSSLNAGDVFILDTGDVLYQFQGKDSSGIEKVKAAEYLQGLEEEREGKAKVVVVDQRDSLGMREFWKAFGKQGDIALPNNNDEDKDSAHGSRKLFQVIAEKQFEATPSVSRGQLNSNGVFILDASYEVFAWIGRNAPHQISRYAFQAAHDYVVAMGLPTSTPISKVYEQSEPDAIHFALSEN